MIPTLEYLCLKKLDEENPFQVSKLMANYENEFGDSGYILEEEKSLRKYIKGEILEYGGYIFGGAIRDEILGEYPRNYNCFFNSDWRLEKFICLCKQHLWSIEELEEDYFISKIILLYGKEILKRTKVRKFKIRARIDVNILDNLDYSAEIKLQKKRLADLGLLKIHHRIEVPINVSSHQGSHEFSFIEDTMDMDVNQLYYNITYDIQSKVKYMMKDVKQLKKQILRKEFKMFCRNDSFLDLEKNPTSQNCVARLDPQAREEKKKMESMGWKCINKPCVNPYCMFATEEAITNEMIRIELHNFRCYLLRNFMEMNERDNFLAMLNENETPLKSFNGNNFVKKRKSKRKEDSRRAMRKFLKNKRKKLLYL